MLILKCENCGNQIEMQNTQTSVVCPYCGTTQVPARLKKFLEEERLKKLEVEKRLHDELMKKKQKRKKILIRTGLGVLIPTVAVVLFLVFGTEFATMLKYNRAQNYLQNGKYQRAYEIFNSIPDYKDSTIKSKELEIILQKQALKGVRVGDTIKFGSYEQDNNLSNGNEELEWIVLEKKNDDILVISKYCLFPVPYNDIYEAVTWETCYVREYLNNTFSESAFSHEQRTMIESTLIRNIPNPEYYTYSGNDTVDKVFLLNTEEFEKYGTSPAIAYAPVTKYAEAMGSHQNLHIGTGLWWLRTTGASRGRATYITDDGRIYTFGEIIEVKFVSIRPAMWINTNIND